MHKFLLRTEPVIESDWSRSGKFSSQHCGLIREAERERERVSERAVLTMSPGPRDQHM